MQQQQGWEWGRLAQGRRVRMSQHPHPSAVLLSAYAATEDGRVPLGGTGPRSPQVSRGGLRRPSQRQRGRGSGPIAPQRPPLQPRRADGGAGGAPSGRRRSVALLGPRGRGEWRKHSRRGGRGQIAPSKAQPLGL